MCAFLGASKREGVSKREGTFLQGLLPEEGRRRRGQPRGYKKCKEERLMEEQTKYFVLKQKAVPEVLLKVVQAKRLIESERAMTVQEATDRVGISRSSFYKYKDDIFPFYDNAKGRTITLVLQMDDERGLLSDILHIVAVYKANILTIHQSIPVNNVASLTLSVEVRPDTGNISRMVEEMEEQRGIHYVKIIARE